jgi:hypothetical protein
VNATNGSAFELWIVDLLFGVVYSRCVCVCVCVCVSNTVRNCLVWRAVWSVSYYVSDLQVHCMS